VMLVSVTVRLLFAPWSIESTMGHAMATVLMRSFELIKVHEFNRSASKWQLQKYT